MSYAFPPEIAEPVQRRVMSGQFLSEDEVLKAALRALDERDGQFAAIQAGLADWPPGFIESTAGAWQGDFPNNIDLDDNPALDGGLPNDHR